jgi:hypothetical protein
MELSEKIKTKLGEVIQLWAEEHLDGKPAILGYAVYTSLEKTLIEKTEEINKRF